MERPFRHTPLAVVDADTNGVLGACGIFWHNPEQGVAEIGYWIRREARGRGIATRTVRLLAGWILGDLSYERLELQGGHAEHGISARRGEGRLHGGGSHQAGPHERT